MAESLFVPAEFHVPAQLETDQFRLRMLSVEDVDLDYEAVMESQERLLRLSGGRWPQEGFTRAENLADLERHQEEFLHREAFAYTVVALDESRCLGCVYINPSPVLGPDAADVFMWVRETEYQEGLDPVLFQSVKDWVATEWPFSRVRYPGREEEE